MTRSGETGDQSDAVNQVATATERGHLWHNDALEG